MGVLLDEIYGFLKVDLCEHLSRIPEVLLLVRDDHLVDVLDLFWVFEDLVQQHSLHFEVREVAQVASGQDRVLLLEVVQDKKAVLFHQSAQVGVVRGPHDRPHFLAIIGQVGALRTILRIRHVEEAGDAVDVDDRELCAVAVELHLLRAAAERDFAFLLNVRQRVLLNCAAHSADDKTVSRGSDASDLVGVLLVGFLELVLVVVAVVAGDLIDVKGVFFAALRLLLLFNGLAFAAVLPIVDGIVVSDDHVRLRHCHEAGLNIDGPLLEGAADSVAEYN